MVSRAVDLNISGVKLKPAGNIIMPIHCKFLNCYTCQEKGPKKMTK